jgi:hypothetical protein
MTRKILALALTMGLVVGTASAQFGGVVYDPTNYHNALLRYYQLQKHLIQLQKTYSQIVSQYNLAMAMSRYVRNMPNRYQATFSRWRNATALNTYGNTNGWIAGINTGNINGGYQQATTKLLQYDPNHLSGMDSNELSRVKSQYASVELTDGANEEAMAAIGVIRENAQTVEAQIANLERDSFSDDPELNSEVSVLNKINATNVLTLRSVQDSNKLLASLLEQQILAAKQQRESTANAINADIDRRASLSGNLSQVTGTMTQSLQNFRMQ